MPERVKTHAAPRSASSPSPPIRAVLPSPDSATLSPNAPVSTWPLPVSFAPCCVQLPPERVKTHAAPTRESSDGPPTSAVVPSGDSATLQPNWPSPFSPVPVSFAPSCAQAPPERVNTHAAPAEPSSPSPPIRAVFPSDDRATLMPNSAEPLAPVPVSFAPCCVHVPAERVYTHAAPALL